MVLIRVYKNIFRIIFVKFSWSKFQNHIYKAFRKALMKVIATDYLKRRESIIGLKRNKEQLSLVLTSPVIQNLHSNVNNAASVKESNNWVTSNCFHGVVRLASVASVDQIPENCNSTAKTEVSIVRRLATVFETCSTL